MRVLVATDVASRGLDFPRVDLIIQMSPPKDCNAYVHRSGRTGRAGHEGTCITLFTLEEKHLMEKIEGLAKIRFVRKGFPRIDEVIKAREKEIHEKINSVGSEVSLMFHSNAEELIK